MNTVELMYAETWHCFLRPEVETIAETVTITFVTVDIPFFAFLIQFSQIWAQAVNVIVNWG